MWQVLISHIYTPSKIFTLKLYFLLNHTIYKNLSVRHGLAVCGCMRVCDTSLEPPRPPYERLIGRIRFARTARPQCAKMSFLLHKAPLTTGLRLITLIWVTDNLNKISLPLHRTPAVREICVFYYIRHLLMTVLTI